MTPILQFDKIKLFLIFMTFRIFCHFGTTLKNRETLLHFLFLFTFHAALTVIDLNCGLVFVNNNYMIIFLLNMFAKNHYRIMYGKSGKQ